MSTCFSCCINGDWGLLYYTTNCGIVLPINFTTLAHSGLMVWCPSVFWSPLSIFLFVPVYMYYNYTTSDWLRIWIQKLLQQLSPLFQLIYVFQNPSTVVVHFWFWFTFVKFDNLSLLLPFLLLRRGGGWKWNEILNFLVFVIPLVLLLYYVLLFLLKLLMMKLWQNYFPPRENRLTNWI